MRTLVRSATVVDGSEAPRYRADVLVDDGRVAEIRTSPGSGGDQAERVVDADGLVLSPGFIDMHAH
ncbi:MAG: D-aminoacylase, partial [Actinomycetes bacterium]